MHDDTQSRKEDNYQTFRDCVITAVVEKSSTTPSTKKSTSSKRRRSRSSQPIHDNDPLTTNDPSDLADFADYIAQDIFNSLPPDLQLLSHTSTSLDYSLPLTLTTLENLTSTLPPSIPETLSTYALTTPPTTDTSTFLAPILTSYITSTSVPPPPPSSTRTSACELCARDWIPLTYHHLIPKSTHARALKRNWHREEDLQSVAWLCRACHSFVHRLCGNEELAREWFTVERLREREDVGRWVGWVGGVRWRKR